MQKYQLGKLLINRPDLNWYTPNPSGLDDEPALEAILNYGDWNDFIIMMQIVGKSGFKQLFTKIDNKPRSNLRPEIKHYFKLYINANS